MNAREEVLARVRTALSGGAAASIDVPRGYRGEGDVRPSRAELLDLFVERITDYRAGVRRTPPDALAAAVAAALADGLVGRAPAVATGTGRPRVVVPPGLPVEWLSAAEVDVVRDDQLTVDELDRVDGVVTAAAVAVAETGTIVLDASPDQGRRAVTLVPELHVCVVRAEQVVAGVPDAVAQLTPTRPQTWISGPSATSDIELDRVEGVHGPRTLEVVVVEAGKA
ncbi:MAG: LutC/YkgG family protein [Egibacteraceae bacterium]